MGGISVASLDTYITLLSGVRHLGREGLVKVGENVGERLEPYGDANHLGLDPGVELLLRRELLVRRGPGVDHQPVVVRPLTVSAHVLFH